MSDIDKVFAGSIPEFYDRYMVPLIFQGYADDLATRAAALAPGSVLEIAAGSGVATRALAAKLAPNATYVATDLNQPMLDYAAVRQGADARISWQRADAQLLPFPNATFDVVCCQFGVMFFPDRVAAYREARRVLKPGGTFLFSAWDRIEANVFADDVTRALADFFPDDPPRFLARTPHGYFDTDVIRRDVAAAGFSDVVIETLPLESRAPSPCHAAMAYCQGTPLRTEIEARMAGGLEAATDIAAGALARLHGNGEIAAKIQAHVTAAAA